MTSPEFDVSARIAQLFVYPVKSCAGVPLQNVRLTETGLALDRAWMVVDQDGEFVSQRDLPRMALIQPRLGSDDMCLRAPGMLALHLAFDTVEQPVGVRVWGEALSAFDMGEIAAQWFTDFLLTGPDAPTGGRGLTRLRLVRFDPEQQRISSLKWTAGVQALNQFSDGFPLLVVSEASLQALNDRLTHAGHAPVDMLRFRPNIVLSGLLEHDEDRLDVLHVCASAPPEGHGCADSSVRLKPVKPCSRCPIPNIDPATAISTPEVADTLQSYRQSALLGGAVVFGMNAIVLEGVGRVLCVGDEVSANFRFD